MRLNFAINTTVLYNSVFMIKYKKLELASLDKYHLKYF